MTNSDKQIMRVVAITGGINVPSRRYRIDAVRPYMAKKNIEIKELCPLISRYPPSFKLLRLAWFIAALSERFTFLKRSQGFDAVIIQREMISTLSTLESFLPQPRILDVDDSIFLHRNGIAAKRIAKACSLVVCGNKYLAKKFSQWNEKVYIIPTGVDTNKLRPFSGKENYKKSSIIGWIGTSGNYVYLKEIEPALRKIFHDFPAAQLQIISDQFPYFLKYLGEQLDFRFWKPGIENDLLPHFTIGIMPLIDTSWARGKCAFKMLQCMAAALPVVASSVGMNSEILRHHTVGVAADNNRQWVKALSMLLKNPSAAEQFGINGRNLVEEKYSLEVVSSMWQQLLEKEIDKS